jgi:shikimate dehydrogenase
LPRIDELTPVPEGFLGIAVIGHGTDAELIAELQNAALESMKLTGHIRRLEIAAQELGAGIEKLTALGFKGVNVGDPLKPNAARLAPHFYAVKHSLGSANALMLNGGVYAQNTEFPACMKTLEGIEPGTALVMGAGHSARAMGMALLESGWKVRVWSRSAMKARPLITLLQRYGKIELISSPDPVGVGLIVNATPLGMRIGEMPPINWNHVQKSAVVVDLIVRRVNTELIRGATLRGLRTIDGRELLIEQAAQALEWWTSKPVPRGAMRVQAWKRD